MFDYDKFVVGDYTLFWVNEDTVQIESKRYKQLNVYIDGGDLESLLSGLCSIRKEP